MKDTSVEVNIINFGNDIVTEMIEKHQKNKDLGTKLV